ncbi:glycoside hydrolase family protein [Uliginosibacterium sp. 31-16]|uniref:glycoside hydrolase family protein n=1 Tax=Uliginosibacterium sp. 31-16 TaxID=3068315 RepID=UPI00273F5FE4|nr:glycoside hydrolase family protein [Uliginosibacterium sp. 31-16]MDP5238721.1 glycoside hydrolase family protein [Uliginosibacterium sp. 31-16]
MFTLRRLFVPLLLSLLLCACGGGAGSSGTSDTGVGASGSSSSSSSGSGSSSSGSSSGSSSSGSSSGGQTAKSSKRGIAYDLASVEDLAVLSPGVSWWYNWSPKPNTSLPADVRSKYAMDFYPMLWNGNFDATAVETFLAANPQIKYLLVMNEPNLVDQANLTPSQAAAIWPRYEAIAAHTGVKIVGPAMTWGTMAGYSDPVVWLDAFHAAYRSANANREPQIDYLAFHWYDYGLGAQLDRLAKYGKPFWVTEFANWHSQQDGAQIDTLAKQKAQMSDMVATCESRSDVFRYAWFTGRWSSDPHFTSLLGAKGQLTELGAYYLSLPWR